MKRLLILAGALFAVAAAVEADSQFGANGLGVAGVQSNGRGWGMGGLSWGLDDSLRVSLVNPALGAGMKEVSYSLLYASDRRKATSDEGEFSYNANTFPFFAFLIPLGKRVAVGFGYNLEQDLSTVRTNSGVVAASGDVPEYTKLFERSGSIFRVPGVVSARLFHGVRVGFRLDSYFGNVTEKFDLDFNDPDVKDSEESVELGGSATGVSFGAFVPAGRYGSVSLGWVSGVELKGHRERELADGSRSRESLLIDYPERLVAAATATPSPRITIGAEWTRYLWSDANHTLSPAGGYGDVDEFAVGGELAGTTRKGLSSMPLRIGYRNSPLAYRDIDGHGIDSWSVTAGSGFALGKRRGRCDFAVEYGRIGKSSVNGLEESFTRLVIGVSGQEPWKKRKSYIE